MCPSVNDKLSSNGMTQLDEDSVTLSVVIPSYNEVNTIEGLLRTLNCMALSLEVLVIDDNFDIRNLISGILVLVEKRFKIGDWILVDGIIEGIVEKIGFRSTTIRKFDKSLAIIPNFQFAENAVVNVSETSNWLISWIITLQYDTSVDQLKNIRDQIEDHIKKSDDFDTNIGIAVRVDKFSDSSIDMYVRCFTKSDSWNEWLSVKEKLAIAIKQIVENNKASFAFPSSSIYIEKK